jgi:hypothetical protein
LDPDGPDGSDDPDGSDGMVRQANINDVSVGLVGEAGLVLLCKAEAIMWLLSC